MNKFSVYIPFIAILLSVIVFGYSYSVHQRVMCNLETTRLKNTYEQQILELKQTIDQLPNFCKKYPNLEGCLKYIDKD